MARTSRIKGKKRRILHARRRKYGLNVSDVWNRISPIITTSARGAAKAARVIHRVASPIISKATNVAYNVAKVPLREAYKTASQAAGLIPYAAPLKWIARHPIKAAALGGALAYSAGLGAGFNEPLPASWIGYVPYVGKAYEGVTGAASGIKDALLSATDTSGHLYRTGKLGTKALLLLREGSPLKATGHAIRSGLSGLRSVGSGLGSAYHLGRASALTVRGSKDVIQPAIDAVSIPLRYAKYVSDNFIPYEYLRGIGEQTGFVD